MKRRVPELEEIERPAKKRKIVCPICAKSFGAHEIFDHAANCFAADVDDEGKRNNESAQCPICTKLFPVDKIEAHASTCSTFPDSEAAPAKKKPRVEAPAKKKPQIESQAPVLQNEKPEFANYGAGDVSHYAFGKSCMVCMEESCEIGIKLDCGCTVCVDCFKYYAEHSIKNTQIFKCTKCDVQVSSTLFVAAGIDKEQIGKYTKIEQIHLKQDKGLFRCLSTDCPEAIHMDPAAFEDVILPIQFFNHKSEQEMLKIPGVDPDIARRLIRKVPYSSWDELQKKNKKVPKWVIANLMNDMGKKL